MEDWWRGICTLCLIPESGFVRILCWFSAGGKEGRKGFVKLPLGLEAN